MVTKSIRFDKYDEMGAYHWAECERHSPRYNPPLEARYRVLLNRLASSKHLLDVGCGDGYLLGLASPLCDEATGIDAEATGVGLARKMLTGFSNCAVIQASCYQIPFSNESFDVVLLADVIEHLERPEICLQEISRVLSPTGRFLLTTPQWRPDRKWDWRHCKEYKPEELRDHLLNYFSIVDLMFFWPTKWSRMYSTRAGWKLIKIFCRYLYNPFLRESTDPKDYGQILAICTQPHN